MSSGSRAFIIALCFGIACLGVYKNAPARTRSVFFAILGRPFNVTKSTELAAEPSTPFNATKSTELGEPSACGWKAPYACGCSDDDIETMRRILWNPTALELLNAGLGQPKYEKHTNYTFLQVHEAGFEELRRRIAVLIDNQTALNISCEEVVIKVSIFPKTPLSGRGAHGPEYRIVDTYRGPGCGIYVQSDWQIAAKNVNGWNTVAFPTDDFVSNLTKIENESTSNVISNEMQRFFNILKTAVVFLVPSSVKKVTFGDWKCNVGVFQRDSAWSNRSNISDFETLSHGARFNKSLSKEWAANHGHILARHEWAAIRDIERLQLFIGPNVTQIVVNLAEIMCTTWNLGRKRQALARFALRWFWYTAAFTMRPQLTYNLAMFDCGESLAANYFKQNW